MEDKPKKLNRSIGTADLVFMPDGRIMAFNHQPNFRATEEQKEWMIKENQLKNQPPI